MAFFNMLHQYGDFGLVILRLSLAAIFFVHGLHKWKMWKMQPNAQLPAPMLGILRLLSICEPLGALAVLGGLLTQLASIGFILVMISAMILKIRMMKQPFAGENGKSGWEFELLLLAGALILVVFGAGALSLDRMVLNL